MTENSADEIFALERLTQIKRPHIHVMAADPASTYEVSWFLANQGLVARVLRGLKMQSVDALFDEAVAALQIPYYFGYNWAALDECLADLEWLPGSGYALLITDSANVLAKASQAEFRSFMTIVTKDGDEFAQPVALGEPWDRPAYPFHLILQERPDNLATLQKRLDDTGTLFTILNRTKPQGDK